LFFLRQGFVLLKTNIARKMRALEELLIKIKSRVSLYA